MTCAGWASCRALLVLAVTFAFGALVAWVALADGAEELRHVRSAAHYVLRPLPGANASTAAVAPREKPCARQSLAVSPTSSADGAVDDATKAALLAAGIPEICAADAVYWLPHIQRSLQWWPPNGISDAMITGTEGRENIDLRIQIIDGVAYFKTLPFGWFYPGRNEGVLLAIADSLKPESFLDEGWPAYALKGAAAAAPAAAASAAAASKGTGLRAGADAAVAAATAAAAAAVAPPPVASTADRPIITTPRAYSRAQIDSVPRPPDIDFLTTTVDFPVFQFGSFVDAFAPVGSMAQQHHIFASVAIPDFSFTYWYDNGDAVESRMRYPDLMARMLATGKATPYSHRHRKAVFRGTLNHDDRRMFVDYLNAQGIDSMSRYLDIGMSPGQDNSPAGGVPLANFSQYRVQLYMAGNGYSARLKYLLATGSPVVMFKTTARGNLEEFWTGALEPYKHYVPAYHPSGVVAAIKWLLAHPKKAQAIGEAGRQFVEERLNYGNILCWWRTFYAEYATRLRGPVVRLNATAKLTTGGMMKDHDHQLWRLSREHLHPTPEDDYRIVERA